MAFEFRNSLYTLYYNGDVVESVVSESQGFEVGLAWCGESFEGQYYEDTYISGALFDNVVVRQFR
jgi:hypothetical protein